MNADTASSVRIYSPGQVGVACLLGTPLAACCIMALTYGALHLPQKAKRCLIYGVAATTVVIASGFVLPDSVPGPAVAIGYTVAVYQIARQVQGSAVATHRASGGKIGSWGFVVGVGFLGLGVVFAIIAGISFLLPQ